jgi:hypothetical protein
LIAVVVIKAAGAGAAGSAVSTDNGHGELGFPKTIRHATFPRRAPTNTYQQAQQNYFFCNRLFADGSNNTHVTQCRSISVSGTRLLLLEQFHEVLSISTM